MEATLWIKNCVKWNSVYHHFQQSPQAYCYILFSLMNWGSLLPDFDTVTYTIDINMLHLSYKWIERVQSLAKLPTIFA